MTTLGKYRHLTRCGTTEGHFVILAIDHRAILRDALNKQTTQPLNDSEFAAFKQGVIGALAGECSGVLADPEFAIGAGVVSRTISGGQGLLAPLEVTNYDVHQSKRGVEFIPGWSVSKIKRFGGDGVKLLLYYHPDAPNAEVQRGFVSRIVDECAQEDIPFFLEPIPYSLEPGKNLSNASLRQITLDMVKLFSGMGVDVLKLQFPVDVTQNKMVSEWSAVCSEVNAACKVPWVLLSGGVDFETFARQTRVACEAGAAGVIVGRAIWNDVISLPTGERQHFLETTARERIGRLALIVRESATSWWDCVRMPHFAPGWYAD